MYHWILYLLLVAVLLAGWFINIFTLPGLWLMLAAAGVYAALTRLQYVGLRTVIALFLIALVGEIVEFFSSTAGAKRAGASRRGLIGAVIGGIVGAIFLTIPLWFVGTILGVCLGTFLGALIGELTGDTDIPRSVRVGLGAAQGRLLGIVSKLFFGLLMLVLTMWTALPTRAAAGKPLGPPTAATRPSPS